ncbi:MAG: undecaprenyl-diphosphatase [Frankiales bacterium]|nr:undecaprenyl-diphosphatase [Frankiales bacterium]
MNIGQSLVLGVVEGLTEFLPVSSTGHLTIVESMLGLKVDDKGVTAFTAVIQAGAIAAVILYFFKDFWRLVRGVFRGLGSAEGRQSADWRFAWYIIAGSVPIVVIALAAKSAIEGPLRNLWVVGAALIVWSPVLVYAERRARQDRGEDTVSLKDALVIGTVQCVALVPGVSRSGATISAGLMLGLDRVAATRMAFFLSVPALTGAAIIELPNALNESVGTAPLIVGTITSFFVAYASVAWLLRFVAHHSIAWFVPYRVVVGLAVFAVLTVKLAT